MGPTLLTPPRQKRPGRRLLAAVILLFAAHVSAAEAKACSCVESGTPPCAAYWRAKVTVSGGDLSLEAATDADGQFAVALPMRVAEKAGARRPIRGRGAARIFGDSRGGAGLSEHARVGLND